METKKEWTLGEVVEETGFSENKLATYLCRYRKLGYFRPGRGSGNYNTLTMHDRAVLSFLLENSKGPGKSIFGTHLVERIIPAIRSCDVGEPSCRIDVGNFSVIVKIDWP